MRIIALLSLIAIHGLPVWKLSPAIVAGVLLVDCAVIIYLLAKNKSQSKAIAGFAEEKEELIAKLSSKDGGVSKFEDFVELLSDNVTKVSNYTG